MYAFISNEYKTIVHSQRQLEFLSTIYSYPKWVKVKNKEEARKFFIDNDRAVIASGMNKYGKVNKVGYISIEYFIDGKNIYYNVYTQHFGFIKLFDIPSNVKIDSGYDLMKVKVCNVKLDNTLIAHHCIAIQNILRIFGNYINMELILPNISIYLALTKYTGTNFNIRNVQNNIESRFGEVYYTLR